MRPNLIKGKLMRKKILHLILAGTSMLIVTACAHSNFDRDTDTTAGAHARNYTKPSEAIREPAIPDYPCGEILVHEPTLKPRRTLVNEGDPDTEHYWVTAYWDASPMGWVYVPAHAEASPGSRWP